jgi:hypothetical protein
MPYATIEDRVDRLDALFGQFMTEMALTNKRAEEHHRAAEERAAKEHKEANRRWGDLANKLGTIIEDILAPNLRRLARDHFQFPTIDDFMIRRWRRRPGAAGVETEFDTLVVGPDAVILGEAKSTPTLKDVEDFAAKVAVFYEFFPEYQGRRLIPVLGSWGMADPIVDALTARRIYAMRMGEETMELANAAALESTGTQGP